MVNYYGFAYHPDCLEFLQNLPPKIRRQIINKINRLAADPYPQTAKPLKDVNDGEERVWRERSGDYRILYVVRDVTVVIIDIGDRKDVYR